MGLKSLGFNIVEGEEDSLRKNVSNQAWNLAWHWSYSTRSLPLKNKSKDT
jgi:hypothetical protein